MSIVFTPEMFALLDSKTQKKMLAVVSGTDAKPKKVLSPEHLAKMKTGREAAATKKAAEKAAELVATAPLELVAVAPLEIVSVAPIELELVAPLVAPLVAEKPKKVLSPEHLAKMKAGREAAAAKKAAEKTLAANTN